MLHLRDFPITELKINRALVSGLTRGGDDAAIVSCVLSLAVTLGLEVVAVGVETSPQLIELQLQGCAFGQGSLFSSPLSADELDALRSDPRTFLA